MFLKKFKMSEIFATFGLTPFNGRCHLRVDKPIGTLADIEKGRYILTK